MDNWELNISHTQCECRRAGFDSREGCFVPTCRHPDNIPDGCSWGKCEYESCPKRKSEDINYEKAWNELYIKLSQSVDNWTESIDDFAKSREYGMADDADTNREILQGVLDCMGEIIPPSKEDNK